MTDTEFENFKEEILVNGEVIYESKYWLGYVLDKKDGIHYVEIPKPGASAELKNRYSAAIIDYSLDSIKILCLNGQDSSRHRGVPESLREPLEEYLECIRSQKDDE